jgi:hypothetical protein
VAFDARAYIRAVRLVDRTNDTKLAEVITALNAALGEREDLYEAYQTYIAKNEELEEHKRQAGLLVTHMSDKSTTSLDVVVDDVTVTLGVPYPSRNDFVS